jgi:hypothetical protein
MKWMEGVPGGQSGPRKQIRSEVTVIIQYIGLTRRTAPTRLPSRSAPFSFAPPPSISTKARSTVGRLKLLLPKGPTTPAPVRFDGSVGVRNVCLGSRSELFALDS